MNTLSLCSGIGGIELGLLMAGVDVRPVWWVENDAHCRAVLERRSDVLGVAPIWDDLRTFDARPLRGKVDLVTAGFPCQPWSVAGLRRGADDDRHLWPDIFRVVCECVPRMVFVENVQRRAIEEPWADLESLGLSIRAAPFESSEVGAGHYRRRWFLVANADGFSLRHEPWRSSGTNGGTPEPSADTGCEREREPEPEATAEPPARTLPVGLARNANGVRDEQPGGIIGEVRRWARNTARRASEPEVARMVHGLSRGLARIRRADERSLGNAVDPDVVALAWRTLNS